MTDLTEQWKKGELPEGFYWVKVKEEIANYPILADCVRRYEYYDVYTYFPEYEDSITSVLAPVPSYEEWLKKTKSLKVLAEAYCKEKQQNDKLKEVIHIIKRQCELLMPKNGLNPVGDRAVMKMFLNKIDEVLNA